MVGDSIVHSLLVPLFSLFLSLLTCSFSLSHQLPVLAHHARGAAYNTAL